MPNWAWSGYMQPLQIDEAAIANFLPGPKGYWDGKLYSIGLWDAAIALTTDTSVLADNLAEELLGWVERYTPPEIAARIGAPSFGCISAAACSSSPSSPTRPGMAASRQKVLDG